MIADPPRSGRHKTASLLRGKPRPDSTFSAVHHERRLEDLVLRASAPLAGAEIKLQEGITPEATWAHLQLDTLKLDPNLNISTARAAQPSRRRSASPPDRIRE
jgi:hypothetical protein